VSSDSDGIPRAAVLGTACGLILMAFFTTLWGSWSLVGLSGPFAVVVIVAFSSLGVVFVVEGIRLLRVLRRFPTIDTASRRAQTGRIGLQFGIIFGIEGVLIGAASSLLVTAGLSDYLNPVTALIVGLHFIPLARVFERTIDHYIAGWVVIVALVGICLLALTETPVDTVWAIVSLATACGTSAYGIYMRQLSRRLRGEHPAI
jgi:hypothetical protein